MRVLQFGFGADPNGEKHLPHRFVPHCIVYTGTHDNDTARGWLNSAQVQSTQSAAEVQAERAYALRYLGVSGEEFHWDMIRLAMSSVADVAIIPMQDVLGLDSKARMNVPGKAQGNWGWRYLADQLTTEVKDHLAEVTAIYSRWNGTPPARLDPHHLPSPGRESAASKNSGAKPQNHAAAVRIPRTKKKSHRRDGSVQTTKASPRKKGQG
jgi:4-alpha-glucanotransferase